MEKPTRIIVKLNKINPIVRSEDNQGICQIIYIEIIVFPKYLQLKIKYKYYRLIVLMYA